jgi:protease IV
MQIIMWSKLYKTFRSSFGVISVILVIGLWSVASYYCISYIKGPTEAADSDYVESSDSEVVDTTGCNVMGINLHGTLVTYSSSKDDTTGDSDIVSSDRIRYFLDQAQKDENIKAIILEIDSLGGLPVAAEETANAIKASTKPTVALIRQSGVSAAYWSATGAQKIYASALSDVGSIGVTSSYVENFSKNKKDGYDFISLIAGKYKDMGNPDKPLTEEEKALVTRDLNITHQNFIEVVSINRKIPIADVQKIADGSSVLGAKAKELHLIDEIGGISEVEKYLSDKIGEKAEVCWY